MVDFSIADAQGNLVGPNFRLAGVHPGTTPGFSGDDEDLEEAFTAPDEELLDLQKKLHANATVGVEDTGSLLVILQGTDTSGKGGVVRHVFGLFPPVGLDLANFGRPTDEELEHDFLWRIRPHAPEPGRIAVWDRSHYEDVLVQRVHEMVSAEEIERRYGAITEFEWELAQRGTRIIKVMLHISKEFQEENLRERLEKKSKRWKYDPNDVTDRAYWDEYQEAFELALRRTSTAYAPWYCVPSDDKDYARMVVKYLVLDALREMKLEWPEVEFDPETELERLRDS
ncbi:PPK2 family polyphosphate kinase [Corynebacterium halotolerans]|uniref:PPK2 family polyphosphate kinase n=1 Tax=Corynebacterium halotolerans TaxID=225326 RepID=UPI003CF85515